MYQHENVMCVPSPFNLSNFLSLIVIKTINDCIILFYSFYLVYLKEALAQAFEHEIPLVGTEKSYFKELSSMLEKKRDLMAKLLTDVGFKPTIPEGGYFMMADTSDIGKASLIDKPFPRTII